MNIEKHLKDYIKKFDAVELTKKYHCTFAEAIDTLEILQNSDEIQRIIMTLD